METRFVGLNVPVGIVEYATQQAKLECEREGKSIIALSPVKVTQKYVEDLLAKFVVETGLPTDGVDATPTITIESAAEAIVASLEPEHQHKLRQVAKETNHPLAAYVISPMLLANDSGAFSTLLGRWADTIPSNKIVKSSSTPVCEYCQQPIVKPNGEGQRFCNMPEDGSDSCGAKWNRANVMPTRETAALERAYGPQRQLSL